jgi:hypothetical protein
VLRPYLQTSKKVLHDLPERTQLSLLGAVPTRTLHAKLGIDIATALETTLAR